MLVSQSVVVISAVMHKIDFNILILDLKEKTITQETNLWFVLLVLLKFSTLENLSTI